MSSITELTFSLLSLQYLVSLGIQSLVQQGATQGKTAHKLMDTLKDTDILHWKHSLSELIEIRLALTTSIWRMYGKRSDPRPGCFAADWLFLMVTADLPPNHNSEYLSGSLWLRDEAVRAPPGVGGGVTMDIIMTPPTLCLFQHHGPAAVAAAPQHEQPGAGELRGPAEQHRGVRRRSVSPGRAAR